MSHTYTHLITHVIFSTKHRLPYIDADLKTPLHAYMGGIIRELGGRALTINGVADHVHLLLSLPPTRALAEVMRVLKANSSRWVHQQGASREAFAWQTGYGAFSVSHSGIAEVMRYIDTQEAHHHKVSFQDEFLAFLQKHDVAYDERYLWD